MRIWLKALAFASILTFALSAPAGGAFACGGNLPCEIAGGHYFARQPAGWDGVHPLPVILHFHGFREEAREVIGRPDLAAIAERLGVLLVVPQGQDMRWSGPDAPSGGRDDLVFFDILMADLARRWPLAEGRMLASGFSNGASFVWSLACQRGGVMSGFMPIAGTFWVPEPAACPGHAGPLLHIHGVGDRQVPLEGRALRGGAVRQGDVWKSLARFRLWRACTGMVAMRRDALICEEAEGCKGGPVALCLHPGGHDFDPSWLELGWRWLAGSTKH